MDEDHSPHVDPSDNGMPLEGGRGSEELLPLVYGELKRLASAKMFAERDDHTLQTTALVNEAYLRLAGDDSGIEWDGEGHFFAAAAEAMRRILVDHARARGRQKRGGSFERVPLDSLMLSWKPQYGDVLDLHQALEELEAVDPQAAELVKLRCFAGQTMADSAALMDMSLSSAKRCWAFGRAWLHRNLQQKESKS